MASDSPPASRRALRGGLEFGLTLLVGLMVLEGVYRFGIQSPKVTTYDEELGTARTPNARLVHSSEGYSVSHVGADGLLPVGDDLEPGAAIVAIGDSYTEALQVSPAHSFPARLERMLGVDVVNAGHSGWSPAHALNFLRRRRARFEDSLIILQVNDGDAVDLFRADSFHIAVDGVEAPDLVNGNRLRYSHPITLALYEATQSSALLNRAIARARLVAGNQRERLRVQFSPVDTPRDDSATAGADERVGPALRWVLGQLTAMQPDVIVLYIPELRYSSHGCARTRPDLRALYATVSSEQNVPFVDPGEAFCAEFERTGQPLHGFQNSHLGTGHINARGHALVSDLLAQVIRTRLP